MYFGWLEAQHLLTYHDLNHLQAVYQSAYLASMGELKLRTPVELGWEIVDEVPDAPRHTPPTREAVQEALGKTSINYFGEGGETTTAPVIHFPRARRYGSEITGEGWE